MLEKETNVVKIGNSSYFLIPEYVKIDDRFPFDLEKDKFVFRIVNKKIIIEKEEKENE